MCECAGPRLANALPLASSTCTCCAETAASLNPSRPSPANQRYSFPPPRLRNGQLLGRGAQKTVHAEERNGRMVAVMRSRTRALTLSKEAKLVMRIAEQSPHPHVMKLIAIEFGVSSRVKMIAPIASFGSMLDLADHLEFECLEVGAEHKQNAFDQALSAVLHLNAIGIDHGDVAARNLLVFRYDPHLPCATVVQLCDFGDATPGTTSVSALRRLARELSRL